MDRTIIEAPRPPRAADTIDQAACFLLRALGFALVVAAFAMLMAALGLYQAMTV